MNIDLFKTNGSSPPVALGTSAEEVRYLWTKFLPDIPLTDTRWFERYERKFVRNGLRITAENRKNGKTFKAEDEKNVGKYVIGIIRSLRLGKCVERIGLSFVVKAEFCFESDYRITPADRARFAKKLTRVGECLFFGSASTSKKYPKFSVAGRTVSAHFFGFFNKLGFLPKLKGLGGVNGLHVAHTCGKRPCCNPDHLRLMTKELNLKERRPPSAVDPVTPFHCATPGDYGSTDAMSLRGSQDTSLVTSIEEDLGRLAKSKLGTNHRTYNSITGPPELSVRPYVACDVQRSAPSTEVISSEGDISI